MNPCYSSHVIQWGEPRGWIDETVCERPLIGGRHPQHRLFRNDPYARHFQSPITGDGVKLPSRVVASSRSRQGAFPMLVIVSDLHLNDGTSGRRLLRKPFGSLRSGSVTSPCEPRGERMAATGRLTALICCSWATSWTSSIPVVGCRRRRDRGRTLLAQNGGRRCFGRGRDVAAEPRRTERFAVTLWRRGRTDSAGKPVWRTGLRGEGHAVSVRTFYMVGNHDWPCTCEARVLT